jgi:hypothetical protein
MFERLGVTKFAYDWRENNSSAFETEIETMKSRGVEILAWWFPFDATDPGANSTLEVLMKENIHPHLWINQSNHGSPTTQEEWAKYLPADVKMPMSREEMEKLSEADRAAVRKARRDVATILNGVPATAEEQETKLEKTTLRVLALEKLAAQYGMRIDLYNNGGWFGIQDNQLAILERLKKDGVRDVGTVYNFEHARDGEHDDTKDFAALWPRIQSHVFAVNISGIGKEGNALYPSQGDSDLGMMQIIQNSGWHRPVGIIAVMGGDAEEALRNDMVGLAWIEKELEKPRSGGAAPFPQAP